MLSYVVIVNVLFNFYKNNELRIFKLKLYINFLFVIWFVFISFREEEIKNYKNDNVKNGYDCIEYFYII